MFGKILAGAVAGASLFVLSAPAGAQEMVDDLVAKHVAARGGLDALRAIQSITATGTLYVPGFDVTLAYRQFSVRPGRLRTESSLQGLTQVQAYDGTSGWRISPFQGRRDPERMTADDAKVFADGADFEDALVNYKTKGNVVTYLGPQDVDGAPAYALHVQLKDGDEETYYLDPDAMLAIRIEAKAFLRGAEVEQVTDLGDYEKHAGVWFPQEIAVGRKDSSARSTITLDTIVINGSVPDSLFAWPGGAR